MASYMQSFKNYVNLSADLEIASVRAWALKRNQVPEARLLRGIASERDSMTLSPCEANSLIFLQSPLERVSELDACPVGI